MSKEKKIIKFSLWRSTVTLTDFRRWTGQEYKPYTLLLGVAKISKSTSDELTGSKKKDK